MKKQRRKWMTRVAAGVVAGPVGLWTTLLMVTQAPAAQVSASVRPEAIAPSTSSTTPALRTLANRVTSLPKGPLIVEAFAPWCKFCATTAKWNDGPDARWVHQHHLPFVMTDVSALGGVGHAAAAPTLVSIERTAHDGSRVPLSTNAAIAANLRRFRATYHLTVPVRFWAHGIPPLPWAVSSYPTFLALNAQHKVMRSLIGYHTSAQFEHWAAGVLDALRQDDRR